MDLPTYTSIWRIEKRLYKLYDFRLPMPLPIGQVTVFAAIAVPYVVLLTMLGLPFNHTLIWLYVLPPGLATWLATRPVLESKRLPELVKSQLRYLAEPRVLCRMAPLSERDVVVVSGRVWRPRASRQAEKALAAEATAAALAGESLAAESLAGESLVAESLAAEPLAAASAAMAGAAPAGAAPASAAPVGTRRRPLGLGRSRALAREAQASPGNPGALPAWVTAGPAGRPAAPPSAWAPGPLPSPPPGRPVRQAGPLVSWPPGSSARQSDEAAATGTPGSWPPASAAGAPGAGRAAAAAGAPGPARFAGPPGSRLVARGRPAPEQAAPGQLVPPQAWASPPAAPEYAAPAAPEYAASAVPDYAAPAVPDYAAPAVPAPAFVTAEPAGRGFEAPEPAGLRTGPGEPAGSKPVGSEPVGSESTVPGHAAAELAAAEMAAAAGHDPVVPRSAAPRLDAPQPAAPQPAAPPPGLVPQRPAITVVSGAAARATPPAVERALAGPSARRGDVRAGRVSVVPGGHRPGQPDLLQRDRARAQLPIGSPARIVVLGCTVGAGQTMTALLTGEVLASLRTDKVAALDLNPGSGSLAQRAESRPALSQAGSLGSSRLVVVVPPRPGSAGHAGAAGQAASRRDPAADALAFSAAADRHELVLADPATAAVPRLLAIADQLVLVAPASAAAPGAIAMTFEWLEAHGQAGLAAGAVMVLNGVSRRSAAFVDQAERVCAGRCRAIVRVPWDDQLQSHSTKWTHPAAPGSQARQHWAGLLSPATAAAYTALAGVLVASLADRGADRGAGRGREHQTAQAGQVPR